LNLTSGRERQIKSLIYSENPKEEPPISNWEHRQCRNYWTTLENCEEHEPDVVYEH